MVEKLSGWFRWATCLIFCLLRPTCCLAVSSKSSVPPNSSTIPRPPPPPIVYTIAGSDSGGGAGIQADLHAIANFGCHGCSAITCLTAQNSVGVTSVCTPPVSFFREQLEALVSDFPPVAIKIGMLATKELVLALGVFLKQLRNERNEKVWVVLDPVMISTSGSRLLDNDAQQAIIDEVFPYVDIVTPNKYEAEALLNGRTINTRENVEQAASDLLDMMMTRKNAAVLIKGGHTDENGSFAQDYFLSRVDHPGNEPRLCDGGVWLRSPRYDTIHTHGTGCTLSSSIAAALALGETSRRRNGSGVYTSIYLIDACCLAKAYVTAGISQSTQLGTGPGPVAQTCFPDSYQHYPTIPETPVATRAAFRPMNYFGRVLPIVDSVEWVQKLCQVSVEDGARVQDIQLRIKDETDPDRINEIVKECQRICKSANVRLWVNDHWKAAVEAGCFGVHVGQEDLLKCKEAGGLHVLRENNVALGISTHSFGELAVGLGIQPSYISLGPVFATGSKKVKFDPQGLDTVTKWRKLVPPSIPLVAIGGIGDADTARRVREAGADCVAVIGAVTASENTKDVATALSKLDEAMAFL